jgi:hypothetical protein
LFIAAIAGTVMAAAGMVRAYTSALASASTAGITAAAGHAAVYVAGAVVSGVAAEATAVACAVRVAAQDNSFIATTNRSAAGIACRIFHFAVGNCNKSVA